MKSDRLKKMPSVRSPAKPGSGAGKNAKALITTSSLSKDDYSEDEDEKE